MAKTTPPIITSTPLTAEAREAWLHDLFGGDLVHYGELFVPRDSFYAGKTSHAKARTMLRLLCEWLGIKPGYIALRFESKPDEKNATERYTIFLESYVVRNEFLLGATIAMALTRYLLEEQKQIHLASDEQRSIVATATVVFGLGIVLVNGLEHDEDFKHLLGTIPPGEYAAMLHGYTRQRAIPLRLYHASLTPWANDLLQLKKAKRLTHAATQAYMRERHRRFQLIGLLWLLLVTSGIGLYVFSQRVMPESAAAKNAREHMELLQDVYAKCQNTYMYHRQYADISDIQVERSLNAEQARCRSLKNEHESAQAAYHEITKNSKQ